MFPDAPCRVDVVIRNANIKQDRDRNEKPHHPVGLKHARHVLFATIIQTHSNHALSVFAIIIQTHSNHALSVFAIIIQTHSNHALSVFAIIIQTHSNRALSVFAIIQTHSDAPT
jgi:hypothetical protein